jgi:hypothetical protein
MLLDEGHAVAGEVEGKRPAEQPVREAEQSHRNDMLAAHRLAHSARAISTHTAHRPAHIAHRPCVPCSDIVLELTALSPTCRHTADTGAMTGPTKPMTRITAFITYSFSALSGRAKAAKSRSSSGWGGAAWWVGRCGTQNGDG